jgi:hypothetical protein
LYSSSNSHTITTTPLVAQFNYELSLPIQQTIGLQLYSLAVQILFSTATTNQAEAAIAKRKPETVGPKMHADATEEQT